MNVKKFNLLVSTSCENLCLVSFSQGVISGLNGLFRVIKSQNKRVNIKSELDLYFDLENVFNVGVELGVKTNIIRIIFVLLSNYINKEICKLEKLKVKN